MLEVMMHRDGEEIGTVETKGAVCLYLTEEGCGVMSAIEAGVIETFAMIDGLRKMADELESQIPGGKETFELLAALEDLSRRLFDDKEEDKVEMSEQGFDALAKAIADLKGGE